jgi:hypothetical protein
MKITQISLFVENRTGSLNAVARILKENNINIYTLSLADTDKFGILRLLVRDPDAAKTALEKAGLVANAADVFAIPVPDRPGGLSELLEKLDSYELAIDYMYAFTNGPSGSAVMVFRFADADKAFAALQEAGIKPFGPAELFA